ncbi:SMI1/KNR4 family protein [Nostoc sp. PCC 7524]|uniref:SMI1/KNR4 family protein n=1 Tax=Nostoc sp. (strain ATCC 29411 / PCC 7524) TaxID=28072 RepID=UPI00068548BE|nr:SMI1/KNR4 family protein [Nostoc sp. PCC 7524]
MDYNNIQLMNEDLVRVTADEVTQLEQVLNTRMPRGYKEYVTTLGIGILNDTVRVYSPMRIQQEYRDFQNRWSESYFWDKGTDLLTKDRVLESIIIADTGNGDELIFHPSAPDRLYVLPIDYEEIFLTGGSLDEAIEWILEGGVLDSNEDDEDEEEIERPEGWYFEPFPSDVMG